MSKTTLPETLKVKLLKQGYSEKMVEELCKWYFPPTNKNKPISSRKQK